MKHQEVCESTSSFLIPFFFSESFFSLIASATIARSSLHDSQRVLLYLILFFILGHLEQADADTHHKLLSSATMHHDGIASERRPPNDVQLQCWAAWRGRCRLRCRSWALLCSHGVLAMSPCLLFRHTAGQHHQEGKSCEKHALFLAVPPGCPSR